MVLKFFRFLDAFMQSGDNRTLSSEAWKILSGTCVVTGGAGFIGCAIAKGLLIRFDRVVAVDNLHPQIHATGKRPVMLPAGVQLIVADIAEEETWGEIVSGMAPDVIVHLAAETGTGQSLAESRRHTHVNVTGTAVMLDALVRSKHLPKQLVLASSRAVYGEGAWRPLSGASEPIYPGQRSSSQLSEKKWDFAGLSPEPSRSSSTVPHPVSVYGATKLAQENILQAWTTSLNVGLKILRFQNVYGPGQSLTNAYTGIVSLFCRMAKHGQSIPLFEDGRMLRDFVFIEDVADALLRTVDEDAAFGQILDVGTGNAVPISQIASVIADLYGAPEPHLSEQYRLGDVRHASCDIQRTSELLGWRPKFAVRDGIKRLAVWIDEQLASNTAVRT